MLSCPEVKYELAEKASSANYLAVLSNAQRNVIRLNDVQYCEIFSIVLIVHELERQEKNRKKKKTKCGKCLGCFPCAGACSCGRTVSALWYVV